MSGTGGADEPDHVRANRTAPTRGTPPGRAPTGWHSTRRAFLVTAAVTIAATVVLVAVTLLA